MRLECRVDLKSRAVTGTPVTARPSQMIPVRLNESNDAEDCSLPECEVLSRSRGVQLDGRVLKSSTVGTTASG
jgi:hypothetical protein